MGWEEKHKKKKKKKEKKENTVNGNFILKKKVKLLWKFGSQKNRNNKS
jgi:hypothetical protein